MSGLLLPSCATVFSLLLCIIFFSKKRIEIYETKIYAVILCVVLADSICATLLQIIAFTGKLDSMGMFLVNIINRIDFGVLLIYSTCMFLYTIVIAKRIDIKKLKQVKTTVLIIDAIMMVLICFSKISVISDGTNFSIEGLGVFLTFGSCGIYILLSNIMTILNIRKLDKRYIPVVMTTLIIVMLLVAFLLNPYLVIISITLTFINYVMYFTIENPDMKMVEDLTKANIQAEKANRAKSDFLSSMSHEIRTPLNAIVGFSEDIQKYKDSVDPVVVEDATYILEASQTLLEIVGNILDINKIEADKMELTEVPYNFKEEIQALVNVTSTRIGEKPINFKFNMAEDIPYELIGDKVHIKQIVNNLLTNSIKYTESGEIHLSVKCINKDGICTLIIGVKDTGRGIKKENIDKLFTKFERLDVEKNTTTEGTGLGLAITKKLVDMMGGKINVQSDFGKGSIFAVYIPQKISKMIGDNELIEQRVEQSKEVSLEGKKVLIVDDNLLNIKVARRALESFKFNLDDCDSGQKCLDKINSGEIYDLILMDIMMPNMSGEETFSKLKEITGFNTPVIALTADAVAGAKEKYKSEGFIDYIAKPFTKEQISEKLEKVFKK